MTRTIHRFNAVVWALLALGLCTAGGCAGIAWMAMAFAPDKTVRARYELPDDAAAVVFVDDVGLTGGYETLKTELAKRIGDRLETHDLVDRVVPYEQLVWLRAGEPGFDRLSIAEVGQRVGADVVLYVHLDDVELVRPDNPLGMEARLAVTVKVIDVDQGRVFPEDMPEGHPLEAVTHELPAPREDAMYLTEQTAVLTALAAQDVVNLFRDHKVPATEYYETHGGTDR
jgi:hypothetical protein